MWGQERGDLEDIEDNWPETETTWSFLMSWMILFYPQEDTLKVSCWYLYYKCVRNGGSRGHWGFLTGGLENMEILDVVDDLTLPQRRYPESLVLMSLLEVYQEFGVKKGSTWRMLRVPDQRIAGHGHSCCHGWSYFTLRKILWKFCFDIFIRSVSQMGGQKGWYLDDIKGSWLNTWIMWSCLMLFMTMVDH